MSGELVVLLVVVAVLVLAALLGAYLTAHRLDRLHIRTDLARASLIGVLERRHAVGAAVARDLAARDPACAERLTRALADARSHLPGEVVGVDPAPAPDRRRPARDDDLVGSSPDAELAENKLGVILAGLETAAMPDDLEAELDDVTDRVAMARRFYNDAVRDTRSLREQALVRLLRLAGHAPMPDYVELVDAPAPAE